MKNLIVVSVLCLANLAFAVDASTPAIPSGISSAKSSTLIARPIFSEPISEDVVLLEETDGGSYFVREEIFHNGNINKSLYSLVSPVDGQAGSGSVENLIWKLHDTASLPSLTPQIVQVLLKAKWLTPQEKEEFKNKIKPKVIIPDKPACDSSEGNIKLKNKNTGEFQTIYKFTAGCGEIDLFQFSDSVSMPTIRSIFRLVDSLKVMDGF